MNVGILLAAGLWAVRVQSAAAAEFTGNGTWCVVSAPAYAATLDRNGSFVLEVAGTARFACSLIRRWVARQSFPEVRLMSAGLVKAPDGSRISAAFSYFWDEGRVEESLVFTCRGVEASYVFTPWAERDLRNLTGFIQVEGRPTETLRFATLDRNPFNGRLGSLDAGTSARECYRMLSLRAAGPQVVDLVAGGTGLFRSESFPTLLLSDVGNYPSWDRTAYQAGEPCRLSWLIFLAGSGGVNLPDARLECTLP